VTSAIAPAWQTPNQRHLVAALGRVRAALERRGGQAPAGGGSAEPPPATPVPDAALEVVCGAFGLTPFERDVLVMCAGVELDSDFSELCAAAHGDPGRPYPTFGLALAALPEAHWSALRPSAPLRRWRLIHVGEGGLTWSPLRIDEHVLHHLTGTPSSDERLAGLVEALRPAPQPASHAALAARIARFWADGDAPLIELHGADRVTRRAVAAAAAGELRLRAVALQAADVPVAPAEQEGLARVCERDSGLSGTVLLLERDEADDAERLRPAASFLRGLGCLVLLSGRDPWHNELLRPLRLAVPPPTAEEQLELWRAALGSAASSVNGDLLEVIRQFRLSAPGIRAAVTEANTGTALWDASRNQARSRLDDLATRIVPAAAWEDLVLPEPAMLTLRNISAQVRRRARVYDDWGFGTKGERGLGISALFAGESGTGKTMAAEVVAAELRLDLYRIDLSSVVSKYIGETERNLRRVFDAAEEGGAILLFDEADALFGKRSEVRDSHDRYANIEVSYLLQRMDVYRGLAILTTNSRKAIDPAFMRRIRFAVNFPWPEAEQRTALWRRVFPPGVPTAGLDPKRLGRLSAAGGGIRNIALTAAFLAAEEEGPVTMEILQRAARAEFAKLEKPIRESEVEGWA
jgi:hypothetical protein